MAYDIRYAGLNERLYRHLLQTRHFMPRPVPKTRVAAWNGSDCDLLLADSRDHYGDLVIGKADTRGIPIVAVTRDTHPLADTSVPPTIPAPRLSGAIASVLTMNPGRRDPHQPALVGLALGGQGTDIDIHYNGRLIQFRPRMGRVFAATAGDLYGLAKRLGERGWPFQTPTDDPRATGRCAWMSSEAFCLIGAHNAQDRLPALPETTFRLTDCPDLGSAADLAYPLLVTDVLCHQASSPGEIANHSNLATPAVRACLWAFRAAGLLEPLTPGSLAAPDVRQNSHTPDLNTRNPAA